MRVDKGFVYNHKKKVEKVVDEFKRQLRHPMRNGKFEELYLEEVKDMVRLSMVREKELNLALDTILYYLAESVRKDALMKGTSDMTVEEFRMGIEVEANSPVQRKKSNG